MVALLLCAGCGARPTSTVLRSEGVLHLDDHLESALIEGSELPESLPRPRVWRFDEPQPDWKPLGYPRPDARLPRVEQLDDALRLTLTENDSSEDRVPHGGLYIELPEWDLEDWAYVVVRLRNSDPIDHLELGVNLSEDDQHIMLSGPFEGWTPQMPVIDDGTEQDYVLRLDSVREDRPRAVFREMGLWVGGEPSVSFDLLSVSLVPREADFTEQAVGVRMTQVGGEHRKVIYTHGSARISYDIDVLSPSRLDFGLGVVRPESPVVFRVSATSGDYPPSVLFEEVHADPGQWAMRSIDLSNLADEVVTLALEVEAEPGTVALWAAPTLSSERLGSIESRPNVILYIIDGGGADYMSLFGYIRSSTPQLERLAASGAVFERAYSSASWTKPSTASFMTSVPHSALGGFSSETDQVPEGATTMAEEMRQAGYQTAVIVSNPYAASLSGLERGADYMIETGIEPNNSESSRLLHEAFWRWRKSYPGNPFWVHFQSTDIHEPFRPVAPFSGIYVDPELRHAYERWDPELYPGGGWRDPVAYAEHGIDPARYAYAQQGLYDEGMAHNDFRLGELIARLEEESDWENTLLIVAADHGYPAACHRLMEPLPPMWGPLFNSHDTHVPLLFVWPGRIAPEQRFTQPVSMLDLLPTVLDLLGLPIPETAQGRSLAPTLLGDDDLEPRPVILDEFFVDEKSGELRGLIEVVDGWWGASLEIGEGAANQAGNAGAKTDQKRPVPLLLYDLRSDPYTLTSVHEEHPELVAAYRQFLEQRLDEHRALREALGEGGRATVSKEQLDALRALGYID